MKITSIGISTASKAITCLNALRISPDIDDETFKMDCQKMMNKLFKLYPDHLAQPSEWLFA